MSDLTILIQGPLNVNNLKKCVPAYQTYGEVIVSCYDTDVHEISLIDYNEFPGVKFIFNPTPTVTWANYANLYLHSYTTLAGLEACTTDQIIKTRSDEYFLNLDSVIEKMQNIKKWVTHSVWFKKVEHEWLHPSDHLIGAKTNALLYTFRSVKHLCTRYPDPNKQFNIYDLGFKQQFSYQYPSNLLFPENVFFLYYLEYWFREELERFLLLRNSLEGFRQVMMEYSDIVPFENLGEFCCTYLTAQNKRVFHTRPEDIYNDPIAYQIVKDISAV